MADTPLGYYKWFPRDFYSSIRVRGMSFTARAIYRELLDIQWESERLPNAKQLPSILQISLEQWNEFAEHLDELFPNGQNERLKTLRIEAVERSKKAAKSGSKGGLVKRTPSKRLPKAKRTLSQTETETETDINKTKGKKAFVKPTVEEIHAYMVDRGWLKPDGQKFFDSYESKGWKIGRNPMKDWKAAVHTWENSDWFAGKGNAGTQKPKEPVLGVDYMLDLKTGKRIPVSEVQDDD